MHKTARVLDALPKRRHEQAKAALVAIHTAATRTAALDAVARFGEAFADHPKATAKVTAELDVLLAFLDYPAEHHVHLRTSDPIESTFSTVRLRTRVTKGAGSRAAGLAMAYKLVRAAEERWRRINAPHLVPLVRAGAIFIDGQLQERREVATEGSNHLADEEYAAA